MTLRIQKTTGATLRLNRGSGTTWKISPSAPPAATNLLNVYPGALAAFSLRNLVNNASGPVVRVRRSSDNAEADFTAEQVANGSLTTFCGAGNGFIRTWYDQSGNGNHASQWTTTLQPQIVTNGALVTVSSKPAISFGGNGIRLAADEMRGRSRLDSYIVKNTADTEYIMLSGSANAYSYAGTAGSTSTVIHQTYGTPSLYANGQLFVGTTRGDVYTFLNGYKLEVHQQASTASNWGFFEIGAYSRSTNTFTFVGTIQELVIYASDQSANRIGIQNNINAYYGIY